jgi:hypothetical protein
MRLLQQFQSLCEINKIVKTANRPDVSQLDGDFPLRHALFQFHHHKQGLSP